MEMTKYAVITPMRDEGRFIQRTIESMIKQTHKPVIWVIVDDGSIDNSVKIINEYTGLYSWIKLAQIQRDTPRQTGSAEVHAFNFGLSYLKDTVYDFIVKLDADIQFDKSYFARLLSEFIKNKKLGIASGIYLERNKEKWLPISMPFYHAAGASKVMRTECFRQIGGLVPRRGWDTADEIKAMYLGWETRHFPEIWFYHLKNEGTAMGLLHTGKMHGEIFYQTTGGDFIFFLFKWLIRIFTGKPPVISGMALLSGYLKAAITQKPLLVTREEALLYKKLLHDRFPDWFHAITFKIFKESLIDFKTHSLLQYEKTGSDSSLILTEKQ